MIHPGAWLIWSLGAATVVFTTSNPLLLGVVAAAAWVVHAAHRRPGPAERAFRTFLVVALVSMMTRIMFGLVGPGGLARSAIQFSAVEGLRLAVLLVVFGALSSVTDPFAVVKLAPRRWHESALAASLALSLAPRVLLTAARVREAQHLRGIEVRRWRSIPALAVPVLQIGIEEALVLAESMDARGHGSRARTRFKPQSWTARGLVTAVVGIGAAAVFAWLSQAGDPGLAARGLLTAPKVSGVATVAAAALAAPAVLGGARR